jgi:hypothetical protein
LFFFYSCCRCFQHKLNVESADGDKSNRVIKAGAEVNSTYTIVIIRLFAEQGLPESCPLPELDLNKQALKGRKEQD